MSEIFVFTNLVDGLYIGTNSSVKEMNGFIENAKIPPTLIIPYSHDNSPVDFIGRNAFCQCAEIFEVNIQARLKAIHFGAFFGCMNLRSINIPPTCTFLGQSSLDGRNETDNMIGHYLTVYFEKNAQISLIGLAGISNYKTIVLITNDIIQPTCVQYFLYGASTKKIFSSFSFSLCGFRTLNFLSFRTCQKKNGIPMTLSFYQILYL